MQKLFASLISLLAACSPAHASDWQTYVGGSASYTMIGQSTFHKDSGDIKVNMHAAKDGFAVKGQVATLEDPMRLLAAEYSFATSGTSLAVQAGRVSRISSLFNDVYGDPGEWGMAVLPLSMYNRRKVHSLTFNALDGFKTVLDHNYSRGNLRVQLSSGSGVVENHNDLQMELTRRDYNRGWDLHSRQGMGDYDIVLEGTFDNWSALMSRSKYEWEARQNDGADATARAYSRLAKKTDYMFDRWGLRYANKTFSVQSEFGRSKVFLNDTENSRAWDAYVMGSWFATENLTPFIGHSMGHKRGNNFSPRDTFIGAAYRFGNWTATGELHSGRNSWQRHNSNVFSWTAVAASLTYRF